MGATLRCLPPYSPDLNPIELVFHPLKAFLRKAMEQTIGGLNRSIGSFIRTLAPAQCIQYFRHAGYEPVWPGNAVKTLSNVVDQISGRMCQRKNFGSFD